MSALGILALTNVQTASADAWKWTGTTPAEAAAASGDAATVYLLNVGKYNNEDDQKNGVYWLGRGGKWGTEAVLSNTPFAFTVKDSTANGTTFYRLTSTVNMEGSTSKGYLGFMNGNGSDKLNYYIDRGRTDNGKNVGFIFDAVSGQTNVFQIHNDGLTTIQPDFEVTTMPISWSSKQGIYAVIDLSNCSGTNEDILSIGPDISQWGNQTKGKAIHFYYTASSSSLLIQNGNGLSTTITVSSSETLYIFLCDQGLYVNGNQVTAATSAYLDVVRTDDVAIGSIEGSSRSHATYTSISTLTYYHDTPYYDEGNGDGTLLYYTTGSKTDLVTNYSPNGNKFYITTDDPGYVEQNVSLGATSNYYMVSAYNSLSTDNDATSKVEQRINGFRSDELPSGESDHWMLISLKELKEYFNQVDAASSDPALATFLISDPDFGRNDQAVSNWKTGTNADLTMESRNNTSDAEVTPSAQTDTYYVGNGYDRNRNPQETYGHQWAAYIKGDGQISQSVSLSGLRAGWYAVRVDVLSTEANVAKVYASYNSSTTAASDHTPYDEETVTTATTGLEDHYYSYEAALTNQYTVMVYVEDPSKPLTIGVKVEGAADGTFTAIDNFTMFYLGDPQQTVLLDESQTSVDYINTQNTYVNATENLKNGVRQRSIVYLKRALNAGKWNSIVLPFSLDRDVINSVFGAGTQVSALRGATDAEHPNRIIFSATQTIEAGKLYIIKPTNSQPTNSTAPERKSSADINFTFAAGDSYWTFSSASFGLDDGNVYTANVSESGVPETQDEGGIVYFAGTYINHGTELYIPANSYVLAGNTASQHTQGLWYYRTKGTKTKGFRGWLQTTDPNSSNAKVEISVNGVVEVHNGETTGIEGLTDEPTVQTKVSGVYNLNGQLVRKGSSVEGLGQGIYIVNGRKYVVR